MGTWYDANACRKKMSPPPVRYAGCIEATTLASATSQAGSGGVRVHWLWKYGKPLQPCWALPALAPGPSIGTNLRPYNVQYLLISLRYAVSAAQLCVLLAARP